jgi:hypothetical protein
MASHCVQLRGRILLRSCMDLGNALNAFLDCPIVHVNLYLFDYMYASYMLNLDLKSWRVYVFMHHYSI